MAGKDGAEPTVRFEAQGVLGGDWYHPRVVVTVESTEDEAPGTLARALNLTPSDTDAVVRLVMGAVTRHHEVHRKTGGVEVDVEPRDGGRWRAAVTQRAGPMVRIAEVVAPWNPDGIATRVRHLLTLPPVHPDALRAALGGERVRSGHLWLRASRRS